MECTRLGNSWELPCLLLCTLRHSTYSRLTLTLATVYFTVTKSANTPVTAFELNDLWYLLHFSQPQHIDRKSFWALFRTPKPLQPSPSIPSYINYVVAVNAILKNFHGSYLSVSSYRLLCCKIFVLEYFRRTSTLWKFFNTKIFPTKISYNYVKFPDLRYCMLFDACCHGAGVIFSKIKVVGVGSSLPGCLMQLAKCNTIHNHSPFSLFATRVTTPWLKYAINCTAYNWQPLLSPSYTTIHWKSSECL